MARADTHAGIWEKTSRRAEANDGLHMHGAGGTFLVVRKKSNRNYSWHAATVDISEAKFC